MVNNIKVEDGYVIVYFNTRCLTQDCWCYGNFYKECGLLEWFEKYKDMADVRNIYCNTRTDYRLKDAIANMFSLVNLKKTKGGYKVSLYRVRRKKLTRMDEMSLAMDYLNYSPTPLDDLPNNIIVFQYDKSKKINIEKVYDATC